MDLLMTKFSKPALVASLVRQFGADVDQTGTKRTLLHRMAKLRKENPKEWAVGIMTHTELVAALRKRNLPAEKSEGQSALRNRLVGYFIRLIRPPVVPAAVPAAAAVAEAAEDNEVEMVVERTLDERLEQERKAAEARGDLMELEDSEEEESDSSDVVVEVGAEPPTKRVATAAAALAAAAAAPIKPEPVRTVAAAQAASSSAAHVFLEVPEGRRAAGSAARVALPQEFFSSIAISTRPRADGAGEERHARVQRDFAALHVLAGDCLQAVNGVPFALTSIASPADWRQLLSGVGLQSLRIAAGEQPHQQQPLGASKPVGPKAGSSASAPDAGAPDLLIEYDVSELKQQWRYFINSQDSRGGDSTTDLLAGALRQLRLSAKHCVPMDRTDQWPRLSPVESRARKTINMGGIKVRFPYASALKPQMMMMTNIISSLNAKRHVLLESPTGSGKTFALLCASLAWQQAQCEAGWAATGGKPARIWYMTKTHSQAAQIAKAVGETAYRPTVAVLGSRAHLCLNKSVLEGATTGSVRGSINTRCQVARRNKSCGFFKETLAAEFGAELFRKVRGVRPDMSFDLEDIKAVGEAHNGCPYFASRALQADASLVIAPYNYMLEPDVRARVMGSASHNFAEVLVFDEGHNIESVLLDAGSLDVTLLQLDEVLRKLCVLSTFTKWYNHDGSVVLRSGEGVSMAQLACNAMDVFDKLGCFLQRFNDELPKPQAGFFGGGNAKRFQGEVDLFADKARKCGPGAVPPLFNALQLSREALQHADDAVDDILSLVQQRRERDNDDDDDGGVAAAGGGGGGGGGGATIPELSETAGRVMKVLLLYLAHPEHYYCIGTADRNDGANPKKALAHHCAQGAKSHTDFFSDPTPRWVLRLRISLMHPGIMFDSVNELAHSVIVTSGTLFPMSPTELGQGFTQRLLDADRQKKRNCAFPHVIKPDQLYLGVVGATARGEVIDGRFQAMAQLPPGAYEDRVGSVVLGLLRVFSQRGESGGSLLFFGSYKKLQNAKEHWAESGLLDAIEAARGPVLFERNEGGPGEAEATKACFRQLVEAGRSPILACVYRATLSEGVNFSDEYCRAVFCVSVPFPLLDKGIKSKMEYNNIRRRAQQFQQAQSSYSSQSQSQSQSPGQSQGMSQSQSQGMSQSQSAGGSDREIVSGEVWYKQQAFRAVNQALGRLIRHRNDYGCVFLVDHRFSEAASQAYLAKWVRGWVRDEGARSFAHCCAAVDEFLKAIPDKVRNYRSYAEFEGAAAAATEAGRNTSSNSSTSTSTSSGLKRARDSQPYRMVFGGNSSSNKSS